MNDRTIDGSQHDKNTLWHIRLECPQCGLVSNPTTTSILKNEIADNLGIILDYNPQLAGALSGLVRCLAPSFEGA